MKQYENLIQHMVQLGFVISVYSHEGILIKKSDNIRKIIEHVESACDTSISVFSERKIVGSAFICLNNEAYDYVYAYSNNATMNLWYEKWAKDSNLAENDVFS